MKARDKQALSTFVIISGSECFKVTVAVSFTFRAMTEKMMLVFSNRQIESD